MTLPSFVYHPDPISSGSIIESDEKCRSCGRSTGYIYTGHVYSEAPLDDALCPWCIADGSAHRKFDAIFTDMGAFSDPAPSPVVNEVCWRTPGYNTWRGDSWPVCCGDATAFLAPLGIRELRRQYPDLEGALLSHFFYEMNISGAAADYLLHSLHRDSGPTAMLFRCLHCYEHHFHVDFP